MLKSDLVCVVSAREENVEDVIVPHDPKNFFAINNYFVQPRG